MATKWGIVSAGLISHDFVSAVRSIPGGEHEIVAVAARKLEDAQAFAKLHNIPKSYGSYEELAKDPDYDVVYIGTVNNLHDPVGKMFMANGKHILMEKPLALNLKQVKALTSEARQRKLLFVEALWARFLPSYQALSKEIKSGAIGDVMSVIVNFGIKIADVERVSKKELGGSSLLDIGIYCLNAIVVAYQGDKPEKIKAVGHLNSEGVDHSVTVSLQYSNGRLASMTTSTKVDLPCELVICGTKGTIRVPKPMWCTDKFTINGVLKEFPYPPTALPCNYTNSSGLRYQAIEVRRCLKEGLLESPIMSHADSELMFTIMDEIRRQVGVVYSAD